MLTSISTNRGFSLVEVLATVLVVTIGLVGLGAMQLQANRSIQDAGNRSQATWLVDDLMNRIRANAVSAANYDTGGVWVCGNAVTQCADMHDGANRTEAAAGCSGATLATFDLEDVACRTNSAVNDSITVRSKPVDWLANPALSVDVNNVGVNNSSFEVTLVLEWDVRTSGQDDAGNRVYAADSDDIVTRRSSITRVFNP
jgi:type IV pilus assembly protein PilV